MPQPNKDPNYAAPPSPTIFIPRDALACIMALHPPTEEQKETLRAAIVKKWPQVYEMTRSESVVSCLTAINVSWRDKK